MLAKRTVQRAACCDILCRVIKLMGMSVRVGASDSSAVLCSCTPYATEHRGTVAGFALLCIGSFTFCTFGPGQDALLLIWRTSE